MREVKWILFFHVIYLISCTKDKAEQYISTPTFHDIQVLSNEFSPDTLNINLGDTVKWTNNSGFHNINASLALYPNNPEGFENSISQNWTFTHTFTIIGTYEYRCEPHFTMGMQGAIVVQ